MSNEVPTKKKSFKKFNSYYDAIFFLFDESLKRMLEVWDDVRFALARGAGPLAGKAVLYLASVLAFTIRDSQKSSLPVRCLKIIIGLAIAVPLFLVMVGLVLLGGTLAGIFGLRNLGEYSWKEELIAWAPAIILLLFLPMWASPYVLSKLSLILSLAVLIAGFDFLVGHCGILTLGHAGFAFLGSFFAAFLVNGTFGLQLPYLAAVPISCVVVAAIGFILGLPSLRVKDHYLLVITLSFSISIPLIFKSRYLSKYSGLSSGGLFVDQPKYFSFLDSVDPTIQNYFFILISATVLIFFAHNLIRRSRVGRAFQAIKCDHEVSMILGVSLLRYKIFAFALSAFYAAYAGCMSLLLKKYVSIDSYTMFDTIDYYVSLVLGGMGSVLGVILGATFLGFEVDLTRFLSELVPKGQFLARIFYGMLLILTIYVAPKGLSSVIVSFIKSKLFRAPRRGQHYLSPEPDYSLIDSRNSPIKDK